MQRVRRNRGQWEEIVREQEKSGLSARAFCIRETIDPVSFYKWRSQIRKTVSITSADTPLSGNAFIDMGKFGSQSWRQPSEEVRAIEVTMDFGGGFTLTVRRG